jgi:hypothetical protein
MLANKTPACKTGHLLRVMHRTMRATHACVALAAAPHVLMCLATNDDVSRRLVLCTANTSSSIYAASMLWNKQSIMLHSLHRHGSDACMHVNEVHSDLLADGPSTWPYQSTHTSACLLSEPQTHIIWHPLRILKLSSSRSAADCCCRKAVALHVKGHAPCSHMHPLNLLNPPLPHPHAACPSPSIPFCHQFLITALFTERRASQRQEPAALDARAAHQVLCSSGGAGGAGQGHAEADPAKNGNTRCVQWLM